METGGGGGGGGMSSAPKASRPPEREKRSKFAAYQNPALSAALTANSIQPSKPSLLLFFSLSAFSLLFLSFGENGLIKMMPFRSLSDEAVDIITKAILVVTGLVFIGSISAFLKAISLLRLNNASAMPRASVSKETKDQPRLTKHQLELLGIKPKFEQVAPESTKRPPKSKPLISTSDILVPVHQQMTSSIRKSQVASDKLNSGAGHRTTSFSTPSKLQSSPSSLYLVAGTSSPLASVQASPSMDSAASTPWSSKRGSASREIMTEEQLERFLAEVDEKLTESAGKHATPPPTIRGFAVASPTSVGSPASTSGTTRSTPLRAVRMSPGSQKFTTPPKKGEGDLPSPMSIEESIEAFKHLRIYPQIELWRDQLRQWFSSVLLKPLLNKIETSHIQVMQAAARLGISITVSKLGSSETPTQTPATVPSVDRNEWQPAFTLDEDGLLHQLCSYLLQTIDASMPKLTGASTPQPSPMVPIMQECVDVITEHQRLHTLLKGEWAKGLLPYSNLPEEYMVQRIRELAEGTCLKNYEYQGSGEVYDTRSKKWTLELPTDSHVLLYLFCAFLEHPKWMLHVDPTSYAGSQSSKNPLFLGVLPPKERFPEKYISVISGVPSILHPGACILVIGKQRPPRFALHWDKKLQFSLQGRTALWDSILLLCHRIKVEYGGIVRGMHLGSSALSILPVLESETEE